MLRIYKGIKVRVVTPEFYGRRGVIEDTVIREGRAFVQVRLDDNNNLVEVGGRGIEAIR